MRKINYLLLPLFFFGFIYFMFLNQMFKWKTFENNAENRALAARPKLDLKRLDAFPAQFDAYLNDNFTFRAPFLHFYHELKYKMKISPNDKDVIIGKNDQLFLAQKDQELFEGKHYFDEKKLKEFKKIWTARKEVLDSLQVPFYWLVGPNKHHVYPEDLPVGIVEKTANRTVILEKYWSRVLGDQLIYPLDELIRNKHYAYFKNDNHWTQKGAYIAYRELMKTIQKHDPSVKRITEKDFSWKKIDWDRGNLANFLGKEGELTEQVYIAELREPGAKEQEKYKFGMPEGFPYPDEYELHFRNDKAKNKKRVLIIRDSFGGGVMPFLNETFSETLYIFDSWRYRLNKEILLTYQPELIIYISLETHVDSVLEYPAVIDKE